MMLAVIAASARCQVDSAGKCAPDSEVAACGSLHEERRASTMVDTTEQDLDHSNLFQHKVSIDSIGQGGARKTLQQPSVRREGLLDVHTGVERKVETRPVAGTQVQESTEDDTRLSNILKYWSVSKRSLLDRSEESFMDRHSCQKEPTLAASFKALDEKTGGSLSSFHIKDLMKANTPQACLLEISLKSNAVTVVDDEDSGPDGCREGEVDRRKDLLLAQLRALLDEVDLPDMDLVFCPRDGCEFKDWGFDADTSFTFRSEGRVGEDLLLLPRSVLSLTWDPTPAGQPFCYGNIEKVVFRGSTTGPGPETTNGDYLRAAQQNMRFFAANLSQHRPDILDAGFTHLAQDWTPFKDVVGQSGFKKGWLTYDQQQCYAAVLNIDGNAQPDRLPEQLLWGIPTVFMHNHTDEFWYPELKSDIHYVTADMQNLEGVIEALLNDHQRRTDIVNNAHKFVQEHLNVNRLKCYLYQLLSEYSDRYTP